MPDTLLLAIVGIAGGLIVKAFEYVTGRSRRNGVRATTALAVAEREQTMSETARLIIDEQRVWYQARLDTLEAQLKTLQTTLTSVDTNLRDERTRASGLLQTIGEMSQEIRDLRGQVKALQAEIAQLRTDLAVSKDETAAAKKLAE